MDTDPIVEAATGANDGVVTDGAIINPYVFVVGAARSGTTLLQRMLDAHPQLAVVNETYWVARKYRERNGLTREGVVTPALLPKLLASPKFSHMGVSEEDLVELLAEFESVRYDRFVSRIFDLYAARRGKRFAADKTPGYVRRIRRLHEVWPRARFVHIVRDPRDVCLSMLDWSMGERTAGQDGTWDMDPALSTALYWRYCIVVGREEAGAVLGPSLYHEVRYEDLVSSPERELKQLCEFLCLPYAEEMTRFYEGRTRRDPRLDSKEQWLPPTAGLRDWHTQLPKSDVEHIEAAVGDLLDSLGYPTRFHHCTLAARAHVEEVRETFTRHLLARGRALPQDW
jgi:sulfotransferase family protein